MPARVRGPRFSSQFGAAVADLGEQCLAFVAIPKWMTENAPYFQEIYDGFRKVDLRDFKTTKGPERETIVDGFAKRIPGGVEGAFEAMDEIVEDCFEIRGVVSGIAGHISVSQGSQEVPAVTHRPRVIAVDSRSTCVIQSMKNWAGRTIRACRFIQSVGGLGDSIGNRPRSSRDRITRRPVGIAQPMISTPSGMSSSRSATWT